MLRWMQWGFARLKNFMVGILLLYYHNRIYIYIYICRYMPYAWIYIRIHNIIILNLDYDLLYRPIHIIIMPLKQASTRDFCLGYRILAQLTVILLSSWHRKSTEVWQQLQYTKLKIIFNEIIGNQRIILICIIST